MIQCRSHKNIFGGHEASETSVASIKSAGGLGGAASHPAGLRGRGPENFLK